MLERIGGELLAADRVTDQLLLFLGQDHSALIITFQHAGHGNTILINYKFSFD